MKFDTIINSIESLPPLNDAILKIKKLYENSKEDIDIPQLVELIESDVLLAANILRVANSPVYGFSRKISSISQAVTLFGIMQVYALIISHAIEENIRANTEVYGVTNERFNNICHVQSALIIKWYSKINIEDAQLLSPIALIMESGKLIVTDEVSKSSYIDEFKSGLHHAKSIESYEKEVLGTTSYNLSAILFNHGHLNSMYTKVLESLDSEKSLSRDMQRYVDILKVVRTAVNMKELLTKHSVIKATELVRELGLEVEPFVEVAIEIKKSYIGHIKEAKEY